MYVVIRLCLVAFQSIGVTCTMTLNFFFTEMTCLTCNCQSSYLLISFPDQPLPLHLKFEQVVSKNANHVYRLEA